MRGGGLSNSTHRGPVASSQNSSAITQHHYAAGVKFGGFFVSRPCHIGLGATRDLTLHAGIYAAFIEKRDPIAGFFFRGFFLTFGRDIDGEAAKTKAATAGAEELQGSVMAAWLQRTTASEPSRTIYLPSGD